MAYLATTILSFILLGLLSSVRGATFEIRNNCPYTVWAAASPGGGCRLDQGQAWTLNVAAGTAMARIWGRTNCNFDGSGTGRCQTRDCTGWGLPPNTDNLDFYDITLVDGFNVPIEITTTNHGCRQRLNSTADINNGQCPKQLRAPGGCNNRCTVFKNELYCCIRGPCGPADLSRFFKERCPTSYSYPKDDESSTLTCPGRMNYWVVFCPFGSPHLDA